jgi:ATP-binding cassette subfamily B protein
MNNNIKQLFGYLKNYKANLFIVFCSLFIVAISLLQVGAVFKELVDNGLSANKLDSINSSILLMSILIAIFAVGSFFRSYFINLVTEKVISQVKADSYKNLLQLEIAAFEELKIGDIISRLSSDLDQVGNLITNFLSFFIRNSIMLIGAITLMFYQSPKLSSLVIIIVPVLLIPLLRLSRHVRSISKKVMVEKSTLAAFIEETFSGIRTLYAFNQQHHAGAKFDEKIDTYIKHSAKRLKLRSLFFALAILVIAGSITMVIWVGTVDITRGNMTSGEMISFIYYAIIVGMSAGGVAELFSEIQGPMAALERVFEIGQPSLRRASSRAGQPHDARVLPGDLTFQNVNFSYPSRPDILALDNISFSIKHNQFTGIVGKSGSGKSTILQLLLGFYQNQSGKIMIGKEVIAPEIITEIRSIIAYAPQDPVIFSGTIKYNITFSNPDANERDILNIIKLCGIDTLAKNLPDGIDTEIGEKGVRLSGGQKQRIAIARALLYKPEILLLDEATSALDTQSEKEILDNIRKLMEDKTIISIAHRITSTEKADNILVIDHGKLVASGAHKNLLKNCDIYLALYKKLIEN